MLKKQPDKNFKKTIAEDWWYKINIEHQKQINIAVAEADCGKVIPHTKMVKMYSKWLKK